jgi:hypothetical protein
MSARIVSLPKLAMLFIVLPGAARVTSAHFDVLEMHFAWPVP